jgi:hypothetical protein
LLADVVDQIAHCAAVLHATRQRPPLGQGALDADGWNLVNERLITGVPASWARNAPAGRRSRVLASRSGGGAGRSDSRGTRSRPARRPCHRTCPRTTAPGVQPGPCHAAHGLAASFMGFWVVAGDGPRARGSAAGDQR